MDSTTPARDGGSRVHVHTLADWEQIQSNFSAAMLSVLNSRLTHETTPAARQALLDHLKHVCHLLLTIRPTHCPFTLFISGSNARST